MFTINYCDAQKVHRFLSPKGAWRTNANRKSEMFCDRFPRLISSGFETRFVPISQLFHILFICTCFFLKFTPHFQFSLQMISVELLNFRRRSFNWSTTGCSFVSRKGEMRCDWRWIFFFHFLILNNCRTLVLFWRPGTLFVWPLVPLFCTSVNVYPGFQSQVDFLACVFCRLRKRFLLFNSEALSWALRTI